MPSAEQAAPGTGTEQVDAVVAAAVSDGQRRGRGQGCPGVQSGRQTERREQRTFVAGPGAKNRGRVPQLQGTSGRTVDRRAADIQEPRARGPGHADGRGQKGRRWQDDRGRNVDRRSHARWRRRGRRRQPTRERVRVHGLPQEKHDQEVGGASGVVPGDGQAEPAPRDEGVHHLQDGRARTQGKGQRPGRERRRGAKVVRPDARPIDDRKQPTSQQR